MKQNKNIPEGYKESPLGIIPDEWEIKRLGSITTKIGSGVTPRGGESVYKKEGRIFLRSQNIGWGTLLLNDVAYIDETTHQKQSSTEVQEGDILLNITGASIGRSAVADKRVDKGNVNQHVCIIRLRDNILSYYINAYILSYQGQRAIDSFQAGGNRQGLNFEQISTFYIPIPPLFEQKTIASVLSIWDKAIEKQTALIEKLEIRKRGLMQQLLTGKKRLPGFSGKWEKKKLKGIAERIIRKNVEGCKNIVTISAQKGFISQTDFFNKVIASESIENYYLVHKNEFCYNKSYSNGYPMGAIKRLVDSEKAVVTTLYICFKINPNLNIDFIEQYFEAGILNRGLSKIANEGGRAHGLLNVTPSDFFNISIKIPPVEEQNAIAKILCIANQETRLAIHKLDQLKKEKKGLMQVLLTGKQRV